MDDTTIMQSQNFEFLRKRWPELASLGGFAKQYAHSHPESALVKLRVYAERRVAIVYQELALPRPPMAGFMELLGNDAFGSVTLLTQNAGLNYEGGLDTAVGAIQTTNVTLLDRNLHWQRWSEYNLPRFTGVDLFRPVFVIDAQGKSLKRRKKNHPLGRMVI